MKKEKYFALSPRIARWKLDTPLENYLSHKTDTSDFWKKIYLLYYNVFDHAYYKKGIEMANSAISNHKTGETIYDLDEISRDMVYCLHRFGYSFQDYCIYNFAEKRDIQYRESFVADKLRYHYCDILNSPDIYQILTNKYLCYQKYKKFYNREVIGCLSVDYKKNFIEFLSHHSSFIYKPLDEHSGRGIEIYKTNDIEPCTFFSQKLQCGPFIVEELVEQGTETARIHPSSVNSCRVLTFTIGKNVSIIGTTWRVGSGGAIKDNAGAGGMYAYINPKTGIVETDAINYKGLHFEKHPDSGLSFIGFQMPAWNEALTLIRDMATTMNGTTLIAWDIAYSKKGWCMIEANENGDWSILQSNKNIGLKNTLFSYMDAYFKYKNNE